MTGAETKKFLVFSLGLLLAACAPSNAAIERAIAQTQTAAATIVFESEPLIASEAPALTTKNTTSYPAVETASPIPDQTQTPNPDMTAEPTTLEGTATILTINPVMIPPKTAAPARKDTASGLLIVAVLFLVGIFVQLESKGGDKRN
jgi:hypothetical protein